jgi:N-acetylneuraminic acid mutarotase
VTDLPGAERQYACGIAINNFGYVIGGNNGSWLNDVWQYDACTNVWLQKNDFIGNARAGAIALVIDGTLYYGTGKDGITYYNDWWQYDEANDTWLQQQSFPVSARWVTAGFAIDQNGYVGTGSDASNTYLADWYVFQKATGQWQAITSLPASQARQYAEGFSIGNFGYLTTGRNINGTYSNDCWQCNPATNSWQPMALLAAQGRKGVMSFVIGNSGFICTGIDSSNIRLNELWEYKAFTGNESFIPFGANLYYDANLSIIRINLDYEQFIALTIIDAKGKRIMKQSLAQSKSFTINLESLSSGLYFIEISSARLTHSYKIVKT